MRFLRAFFIAVFTALVGCLLAFFVGDYLTRLAHVPEMEGQRGMTIVFLCAPLGILLGLVIGIVSAIMVRRQGLTGFLIAQGWSLLIVCGVAGLSVGVPYLLSDKPPRIDGKRLQLQFELRAPATSKIPDQPDGYSIRVCLYTDEADGDEGRSQVHRLELDQKRCRTCDHSRKCPAIDTQQNQIVSCHDRQRTGWIAIH